MKRKTKYSDPPSANAGELREVAAPYVTDAMVRTQIYLRRAEYDFLQSEATQSGRPMAAVIRSLIEERMRLPEDAWTNNPMLKPTPRDADFDLPEDAAINHDHYLYGVPRKYVKKSGRWVAGTKPAETS